jgi:hypothetical protein
MAEDRKVVRGPFQNMLEDVLAEMPASVRRSRNKEVWEDRAGIMFHLLELTLVLEPSHWSSSPLVLDFKNAHQVSTFTPATSIDRARDGTDLPLDKCFVDYDTEEMFKRIIRAIDVFTAFGYTRDELVPRLTAVHHKHVVS